MTFAQSVSTAIEFSINQYLALDAEALPRFAALEGKIIQIKVTGLPLNIYLFPGADGFLVLTDYDGEADATISGSPMALTKLSIADDPRDLLFSGEINIQGDTRVANRFNLLLSKLDIDWEEIAAQQIGDIAAHKIANLFRAGEQWIKRSNQSCSLDAGEYIQEEARLSPANAELRQFIDQVDRARETIDRLEARINQLKKPSAF